METAGKKVLVFGSGKSGIGSVKLLKKHGADVILYDGNEKLDEKKIRGASFTVFCGRAGDYLCQHGNFPQILSYSWGDRGRRSMLSVGLLYGVL